MSTELFYTITSVFLAMALLLNAVIEIINIRLRAKIFKPRKERAKKLVYIAHPISGDPYGNIGKLSKIYKDITIKYPDVIPFIPYVVTVMSLGDDNPTARTTGISHNMEIFERGVIDEVWLFGNKISVGMLQEINKAIEKKIRIKDFTDGKLTQHI